MFLLKTEDLNLKLEIVPVPTLIPHEAIISNVSQPLTTEFLSGIGASPPAASRCLTPSGSIDKSHLL